MGDSAIKTLGAAGAFGEALSLHREGRRQTAELKNRSRQERMAGRDVEIRRKEDMLDELARRKAAHGAGVGTAAPARRVADDGRSDVETIRATTAAQVASLRRTAKNVKSDSSRAAVSSLINSAASGSFGSLVKPKKSGKGIKGGVGGGIGGGMFGGGK